MQMNLGMNVQAIDLFNAMKQSSVMTQNGYVLLYEKTFTAQQNGSDGYGLCFTDSTRNTYIHIRIYGHGVVSSFEYIATLDVNKTADNDMDDLLQELKQKFP